MTDKAEFERLLDVYGFRCERFGQDLSTHARAQVVSAFAALASAPVAGEQPIKLSDDVLHFLKEGVENATQCEEADVDHEFADQLLLLMHTPLYTGPRPKQRKVDWGPLVVAPVAGEAVYTLRVRGAIQAWTPTAAAFSIPDGEHQLFLSPAAPQPSAEPARILFPSHLRKMWSGGEVQAWLDQHQGVTPPPATTTGSLARYRQWKAEQDQAAAPCTCPSGDGSLRHPCPIHPGADKDGEACAKGDGNV